MGLFDTVDCKYELPWPEVNGLEYAWQTKDLGNDLINYQITKDGGIKYEDDDELCDEVNGEVEIHASVDGQWYSVQFWFRNGKIKDMIASKYD